MLNIELQCCALMMLLILLGLFLSDSGLDYSGRRMFFLELLSSILCLFLDILSIFGIAGAEAGLFPEFATFAICKLYVISLTFQTYLGFLYVADEFFAGGSHQKLKTFFLLLFFVGAATIAAMPIDYYISGRTVYSFGPATALTYVVSIFFIIATIVMAFVGKGRVAVRRRRSILLWQASWLAAALVQMMNQSLLLVGFAGAFGMMLLYAELENPHEGTDRMTGLYTANALYDYVQDCYQHGRSFSSMALRMEQTVRDTDPETRRMILVRTAEYLRSPDDKEPYIFRNTDNVLILIVRDRERLRELHGLIRSGLEAEVGVPVRISCMLIPDSGITSSAEEYLQLPYYFGQELDSRGEIVLDVGSVERMREYAQVRELIQSALTERRVEVFYQPFYNVKKQAFTSAEALVRIRDRDGSLVPPGKFIPVAEENGMIVPLGIEIFRQVCAFLASGRPQRLGIERIEVNLSIAQFDDENPAGFVEAILEEYQIDPGLVNLEITETASPRTKRILLKNMQKLIKAGVQFALDDFGTGRSNLDYFVEMPVSVIKFDYTFTRWYFESEKARIVMESTIKLMHRMGMEIVSEGVETEEQFNAMCRLGVEYIQGFYFSRPIPEKEFCIFLEKMVK